MTAQHSGREPESPASNLRERLRTARLYLCTDARIEQGDLGEFAAAVLRGGVDIIQLRHKTPEPLEARQELAALEVLADVCRRHGGLLAVNDRADIASAAAADILHLGQDDLPVGVARSFIGPGPLVGRSTHASAEVDAALVESESDYFCVGPCWPTPTKPGRPAPGLDLVRFAADRAGEHPASHAGDRAGGKPWFAIGGINAANLDAVLEAGARRIVVVRALTDAADPEAEAAALASRLRAADPT